MQSVQLISNINHHLEKNNISRIEKLYNISVIDIKYINSYNEGIIYIYINPLIVAMKKVDFSKTSLINKYCKKYEDIFIHLTIEQLKEIKFNNCYDDIFNYASSKELFVDDNNFFVDSSQFVEYSKIFNYVLCKDYLNEVINNSFNETRSALHYGLEEIIFKDLGNCDVEDEVEDYNQSIKKKVHVDKYSKVPYFIKFFYIVLKKVQFGSSNNYFILNLKNEVKIFTKNIDNHDIYLGTNKVSHRKVNIGKIAIHTISKITISNLEGTDFIVYLSDGIEFTRLMKYLPFKATGYNNITCTTFTDNEIWYFRNTVGHGLMLQKKNREYFETKFYKYKIKIAYIISIFCKKNKILIYEKQVNQFEESGAVLFEKMSGNPNVFYLLKKDSPYYDVVKTKYKNKIISPDEIRYLKHVFNSKYIIGTEVPGHIFTIKSPFKKLRVELLKSNKHKFIFLQHGVMYSLSLDTPSRAFFKKGSLYSPHKVVVSSNEEAKHFVRYGNYDNEDLIVSGLATFDGKRINENANKIVIMITWRPWDEKINFVDTTYYKSVLKIFNSILDKSNVYIVGHPKMRESITSNLEIHKYIYEGSINEILNETKILISDYSSITFDAFYRGTNVIFWWEEKDECLEKYNNKLLLNESNIFGPTIYDVNNLNNLLIKYLKCDQEEQYISRYKKIVTYHDDKNCERIIEKLDILK